MISKPGLIPTVAALLTIALFCRLGGWQLSRSAEKTRYVDAFNAGLVAQPSTIEQYREGLGRAHIAIAGHYDPAHTLLLDNQIQAGQAGVHVYTPFIPAEGGKTILVNRGWMSLAANRVPPEVPGRVGPRTITGVLSHLPQPGIRLGVVDLATADWPQLVPYFELQEMAEALKIELAPQIMLSTDATDTPLQQHWKPGGMSPDKHLAYALQWFSLALAVLVVYLVVNFRRKRKTDPSK